MSFREISLGIALSLATVALLAGLGETVLRVGIALEQSRGGSLDDLNGRSSEAKLDTTRSVPLGAIVTKSPFDDIIYQLKPNLRARFQNQPLETNSIGMRDREYPKVKPAGTFRIVTLGDSIMFGWGVKSEESYVRLLEKRLNERNDGRKYEVLNFAVPGYNTAIEAAVLEHIAQEYQPDLVLVQFVVNDFDLPTFLNRGDDPLSARESYLWRFLKQRFVRATSTEPAAASLEGLVGFDLGRLPADHKTEVLERYRPYTGPKAFRSAIKKISKIAKGRHIPVAVIYATLTREQRVLIERLSNKLGIQRIMVKPFVDAYAAAHGIENNPEARRKAFSVAPNDPHPNATGHQIYSEALFQGIQKLL